jgi:hypothetical protein
MSGRETKCQETETVIEKMFVGLLVISAIGTLLNIILKEIVT